MKEIQGHSAGQQQRPGFGKSATISSLGGYSESYRFPEVPANLYERPTFADVA